MLLMPHSPAVPLPDDPHVATGGATRPAVRIGNFLVQAPGGITFVVDDGAAFRSGYGSALVWQGLQRYASPQLRTESALVCIRSNYLTIYYQTTI